MRMFNIKPYQWHQLFRWTIGKYQQNFATMQQQDAQEFLDFLLSGLHEDLNRVTEKPYTELKDSDGRPDSEVSKRIMYINHQSSFILADLGGQGSLG